MAGRMIWLSVNSLEKTEGVEVKVEWLLNSVN